MLSVNECEQARLSKDKRFDGKFYTCVLTTGIFCRPICPARTPKPENVIYHVSQEAALNDGFRPCKRCIPEYAPALETPLKLKRALQYFDPTINDIEELSELCGISHRHLQRLFTDAFGLAPKKYFAQQRIMLAKKLITESQLTLSEVAFASGFNSIRRFNEVLKTTFNQTPSQLRKQKLQATDNLIRLKLPYQPPFDWALMLSFFRNRQIIGVEQVDESSYQRSIHIGHCTGWLKVENNDKKSCLLLTVSLTDPRFINTVIKRIRRMFDLESNIVHIQQQLSKDPLLKSAISKTPGLRLPGSWDLFEFSIRAILGQQISVKAATTLAKRIAIKYGQHHPSLPEGIDYSFPTPSDLLEVDYKDIGLTKTRISTLTTWVSFFYQHPNFFSQYSSLEELEQELIKLKGIGPWTINYLAMRGLSEPDAFPAADLGIIKALSKNDTKPTIKEISQLSEKWRPWRAYAAMYLWHTL